MEKVLVSFSLALVAVFAPATPYPIGEANLERDGAMEFTLVPKSICDGSFKE